METDVKKIFNYICGSGGSISFNSLLEHPSPLAKLGAEQAKRKLESVTENYECFVLHRKDGQISDVKMYFKTRLCIGYMENKCKAGKTCKYWHICKEYMEQTCTKTSCRLSHDFKDEQNITKIQDLELSHLTTNAIRNIFSNCLPRLCIRYVTSSCTTAENCLDLHLCPNLVPRACSDTNCRFEHKLNSEPNFSVLQRSNLAVTLPEKVIFSHILLPGKLQLERRETDRVRQPMTEAKNNKPDEGCAMFDCSQKHRLNNLSQEAETSQNRIKEFVANEFGEEKLQIKGKGKLQERNKKENKQQTEFLLQGNYSPEGKPCSLSTHCEVSERDTYQTAPSAKLSSRNKNFSLKTQCQSSKKEERLKANLKGGHSNHEEVSQAMKPTPVDASRVTPGVSSSKPHVQSDGLLPTPISFVQKKGEIKENQLYLMTSIQNKTGLLPTPIIFSPLLSNEAAQTVGKNQANKESKKIFKGEKDCNEVGKSDCANFQGPGISFTDFEKREKELRGQDVRGRIKEMQEKERGRRDARNGGEKANGKERENKARGEKVGRGNQGKREIRRKGKGFERKGMEGENVLNWKEPVGRGGSGGMRGRGSSNGTNRRRSRKRGRGGNGRGMTRAQENVCLSSSEVASTCSSCDVASVRDIWEDEKLHDFSSSEEPATSQLSDTLTYSESSILSQGSLAGNFFFASQSQHDSSHQPMVPSPSKTDPYDLIPMPCAEKASSEVNKSSSSSSATHRTEPVEKDVFDYLVTKHKSVAKFLVITTHEDLFPSEFIDKEAWFRERRNTFLVSENEKGEIEEVRAYSRRARLCFNPERCKRDDCKYFHLCRQHVAGQCTLGGTCSASHDLSDPRDTRNLKRYNLEHLTGDQFCHLLRESTPQICNDYNKAGRCPREERCTKLHICQKFVRKRCAAERSCSLDHEVAFSSNHSKKVLMHYDLDKVLQTVVLRVLLICRETQGTPSKEHQLEGELKGEFIHKDLKKRAICLDFILGTCRKGSSCDMHHCRHPYVWQYRDPQSSSTWMSFKMKENEAIEKSFCDSSVSTCSNTLDLSSLHSTKFSKVDCLYDINFNEMAIQRSVSYPETSMKLRRLSTESHLLHQDVAIATKWVWYWNNGSSFEAYGNGIDDKMQKEIESYFLAKEECYPFRIKEHSYKLYFREMHQINLNPVYNTKRIVRRRPIFRELKEVPELIRKSRADARKEKETTLPSEWMKMKLQSDFERFKLPPKNEEFLKIEKLFRQTVSDSKAEVIAIERVQNLFMWEKYQRKKEQMQRRAPLSLVNEKMLFHGTSPELIDNICKENFDWRLSGKTNGARYGHGSYFARDAEYSYHYTGNKKSGSSRYMFVAKVLVGSYTEGKPEMRKPPAKSSSHLYDSCVDDVNNPKIFVVFDIDQYYPSYVIEFAEKASEDTARYNQGIQSAYSTYNQGNAGYSIHSQGNAGYAPSYNRGNTAYANLNQGVSGINQVSQHSQGTSRYNSSTTGYGQFTANSNKKTSSSARNVGYYGGESYSATTSQSHVIGGTYGGSRSGNSSSSVESGSKFSGSGFSSKYSTRGSAYTRTSSTLGSHATSRPSTPSTNKPSTGKKESPCSVM